MTSEHSFSCYDVILSAKIQFLFLYPLKLTRKIAADSDKICIFAVKDIMNPLNIIRYMEVTPKSMYVPSATRYTDALIPYRRAGQHGLRLSALTMGFWWNYGETDAFAACRDRVLRAFDLGITTFDLANNYGPPYGAAEETFGRIFSRDLRPYRHEMVITSKAGHSMWDGPYGDGCSRKMLMTSIDESLQRMQLDYVDIFYVHRYDPEVPWEEPAQALVDIVRSGKALYVGISKYPADKLRLTCEYLRQAHVPCIVYQSKCNILEDTLTPEHRQVIQDYGLGYTAFSPLQQGMLSTKYLTDIPADSRAAQGKHLQREAITPEVRSRLIRLNELARQRGQSLSQMAIAWLLARSEMTSVIIGARTMQQMEDCIQSVGNITFTPEELARIQQA
jgi:L-glyceraldehyde 3-phosphate reductase